MAAAVACRWQDEAAEDPQPLRQRTTVMREVEGEKVKKTYLTIETN
jgi:hypothetical protein